MPATAAACTGLARSMGRKEGGSREGTWRHSIFETDGSQDPLLFDAIPKNMPTVVVIVPCVR
jgi:hypothetical protein